MISDCVVIVSDIVTLSSIRDHSLLTFSLNQRAIVLPSPFPFSILNQRDSPVTLSSFPTVMLSFSSLLTYSRPLLCRLRFHLPYGIALCLYRFNQFNSCLSSSCYSVFEVLDSQLFTFHRRSFLSIFLPSCVFVISVCPSTRPFALTISGYRPFDGSHSIFPFFSRTAE